MGSTSHGDFRGKAAPLGRTTSAETEKKPGVLYQISSPQKLGMCFENIDGERIGDTASGAKALMILVKVPDISQGEAASCPRGRIWPQV